jgi:hypothetical protein
MLLDRHWIVTRNPPPAPAARDVGIRRGTRSQALSACGTARMHNRYMVIRAGGAIHGGSRIRHSTGTAISSPLETDG